MQSSFLDLIKPLPSDFVTNLSFIVLILPLLTFIILIFFGKKMYRQGDWLATSIIGLCSLFSLIILFQVWGGDAHHSRFNWINLGGGIKQILPLQFTVGLYIDNIAALMLFVVNFICFLVHLFSIDYMHGEEHYNRYFAYLGIFTFSMLGIVIADNLFLIYIFWELVGLSSYLLIGFWFKKPAPIQANKKAFLVNRIGDIGMFIGMLIMFYQFGTLDLEALKALMKSSQIVGSDWVVTIESGVNGMAPVTHKMSLIWLTMGGICLFCGCIGKSAQFPLQVWLPDAMEGPTPVSSLIHAATMVAAGVYMVGRIFPLLNIDALTFIAFIGAITAFMAAYAALTQFDLKRVLAFSTISQLGYMVLGMGVGAYDAALFHLITHAFFKCLLFLTAASVIYAMHHVEHELHHHGKKIHFDPQDMRNMGGLRTKMPVTFITYFVATMALAGIPFFTGFLSKDAIIVGSWGWADEMAKNGSKIYYLIPVVAFLSAAMTAFYMGRQMFMTFFGEFQLEKKFKEAIGSFNLIHDATKFMKPALITLAIFTLAPVFVTSINPAKLTNGHDSWFMHTIQIPASLTPDHFPYGQGNVLSLQENSITLFQSSILENIHHHHSTAFLLSIVIGIGSLFIAFLCYGPGQNFLLLLKKSILPIHKFISNEKSVFYKLSYNKWYLDEIYDTSFVKGLMNLSLTSSWFDVKIIDGFVNLVAKINVIFGNISDWTDRWFVDGFVNFVAFFSGMIGSFTRKFQSGNIQHYFIYMMLGVLLIYIFYL